MNITLNFYTPKFLTLFLNFLFGNYIEKIASLREVVVVMVVDGGGGVRSRWRCDSTVENWGKNIVSDRFKTSGLQQGCVCQIVQRVLKTKLIKRR